MFFFPENERGDQHREHIETLVWQKKRENKMKNGAKEWEVNNKQLNRKITSLIDMTGVLSYI